MKKYRLAVLNSHPIQYFAPLYRNIARENGIDITVYYCSRAGLDEMYDPGFGQKVKWDIPLTEGYQYKFLPNLMINNKIKGFFSLVNLGIVAEIIRGNYDALWVHGHNYFTYLLAILVAKMMGISVFMRTETHLLLPCTGMKRVLRKPVMSLFYQLCDACLAIGTLNAEFYRAHRVKDEKIFTVPYSVDNEFFFNQVEQHRAKGVSLKKEIGLPSDKVVILYASKLITRKHPIDLLRAFHKVSEQEEKVALVFVGSGPEEDSLRTYVQSNELKNVYFCGFNNQSELPKYFAIANIFVLPSEDEPWGLIINEAMCAKLPIIASSEIGAVPDLVSEGVNGFSYPVRDVAKLAEGLNLLIRNPNLRRQMAKKSRELIDRWGYNECVQGIYAALEYVTKGKTRTSIRYQNRIE